MMMDEKIATPEDGDASVPFGPAKPVETRQRSTIAFPYNALEDAGELAHRIHANVGHGECSDAQLGAWLGISALSSTFRVRVSSARTFGLIEAGSRECHRLTELGKRYVDPQREREARVDAFLTVPLFRAIFEHYDGNVVPPAAALERQIAAFGVAEKQKGRARSALERSADYADFYAHGRSRLVKPGLQAPRPDKAEDQDNRPPPAVGGGTGGGSGGGGGFDHDPIIVGLFRRLPRPEDAWTIQERQRWLETAAQVFGLIYGDEDEGRIVVSIQNSRESPPVG